MASLGISKTEVADSINRSLASRLGSQREASLAANLLMEKPG